MLRKAVTSSSGIVSRRLYDEDKTAGLRSISKETEYTHTIVFYRYSSGNLWDHCAVKIGEHYVSPYPRTHLLPPEERHDETNHDSSDYSVKLLAFVEQVVRPMIYIQMVLADPAERKTYKPVRSKVIIPVTEAEYDRAHHFVTDLQKQASDGDIKYSVLKFGYSCARVNQTILKHITDGSDHAPLVEEPLHEMWVASWPQSVHERATKLAEARRSSEKTALQIPVSAPLSSNNPFRMFAITFTQAMHEKRERLGYGFSFTR